MPATFTAGEFYDGFVEALEAEGNAEPELTEIELNLPTQDMYEDDNYTSDSDAATSEDSDDDYTPDNNAPELDDKKEDPLLDDDEDDTYEDDYYEEDNDDDDDIARPAIPGPSVLPPVVLPPVISGDTGSGNFGGLNVVNKHGQHSYATIEGYINEALYTHFTALGVLGNLDVQVNLPQGFHFAINPIDFFGNIIPAHLLYDGPTDFRIDILGTSNIALNESTLITFFDNTETGTASTTREIMLVIEEGENPIDIEPLWTISEFPVHFPTVGYGTQIQALVETPGGLTRTSMTSPVTVRHYETIYLQARPMPFGPNGFGFNDRSQYYIQGSAGNITSGSVNTIFSLIDAPVVSNEWTNILQVYGVNSTVFINVNPFEWEHEIRYNIDISSHTTDGSLWMADWNTGWYDMEPTAIFGMERWVPRHSIITFGAYVPLGYEVCHGSWGIYPGWFNWPPDETANVQISAPHDVTIFLQPILLQFNFNDTYNGAQIRAVVDGIPQPYGLDRVYAYVNQMVTFEARPEPGQFGEGYRTRYTAYIDDIFNGGTLITDLTGIEQDDDYWQPLHTISMPAPTDPSTNIVGELHFSFLWEHNVSFQRVQGSPYVGTLHVEDANTGAIISPYDWIQHGVLVRFTGTPPIYYDFDDTQWFVDPPFTVTYTDHTYRMVEILSPTDVEAAFVRTHYPVYFNITGGSGEIDATWHDWATGVTYQLNSGDSVRVDSVISIDARVESGGFGNNAYSRFTVASNIPLSTTGNIYGDDLNWTWLADHIKEPGYTTIDLHFDWMHRVRVESTVDYVPPSAYTMMRSVDIVSTGNMEDHTGPGYASTAWISRGDDITFTAETTNYPVTIFTGWSGINPADWSYTEDVQIEMGTLVGAVYGPISVYADFEFNMRLLDLQNPGNSLEARIRADYPSNNWGTLGARYITLAELPVFVPRNANLILQTRPSTTAPDDFGYGAGSRYFLDAIFPHEFILAGETVMQQEIEYDGWLDFHNFTMPSRYWPFQPAPNDITTIYTSNLRWEHLFTYSATSGGTVDVNYVDAISSNTYPLGDGWITRGSEVTLEAVPNWPQHQVYEPIDRTPVNWGAVSNMTAPSIGGRRIIGDINSPVNVDINFGYMYFDVVAPPNNNGLEFRILANGVPVASPATLRALTNVTLQSRPIPSEFGFGPGSRYFVTADIDNVPIQGSLTGISGDDWETIIAEPLTEDFIFQLVGMPLWQHLVTYNRHTDSAAGGQLFAQDPSWVLVAEGASEWIERDTVLHFTGTPPQHHEFNAAFWNIAGPDSNSRTVTITAPITLTAGFSRIYRQLNYNLQDNGGSIRAYIDMGPILGLQFVPPGTNVPVGQDIEFHTAPIAAGFGDNTGSRYTIAVAIPELLGVQPVTLNTPVMTYIAEMPLAGLTLNFEFSWEHRVAFDFATAGDAARGAINAQRTVPTPITTLIHPVDWVSRGSTVVFTAAPNATFTVGAWSQDIGTFARDNTTHIETRTVDSLEAPIDLTVGFTARPFTVTYLSNNDAFVEMEARVNGEIVNSGGYVLPGDEVIFYARAGSLAQNVFSMWRIRSWSPITGAPLPLPDIFASATGEQWGNGWVPIATRIMPVMNVAYTFNFELWHHISHGRSGTGIGGVGIPGGGGSEFSEDISIGFLHTSMFGAVIEHGQTLRVTGTPNHHPSLFIADWEVRTMPLAGSTVIPWGTTSAVNATNGSQFIEGVVEQPINVMVFYQMLYGLLQFNEEGYGGRVRAFVNGPSMPNVEVFNNQNLPVGYTVTFETMPIDTGPNSFGYNVGSRYNLNGTTGIALLNPSTTWRQQNTWVPAVTTSPVVMTTAGINAYFVFNWYHEITYSASGVGTGHNLSASQQWAARGSTVSINAVPFSPRYIITGWTITPDNSWGTLVGNPASQIRSGVVYTPIHADIEFALNTRTVTYTPPGDGLEVRLVLDDYTVVPSGEPIPINTQVRFQSRPIPGEFGEGSRTRYTYTVAVQSGTFTAPSINVSDITSDGWTTVHTITDLILDTIYHNISHNWQHQVTAAVSGTGLGSVSFGFIGGGSLPFDNGAYWALRGSTVEFTASPDLPHWQVQTTTWTPAALTQPGIDYAVRHAIINAPTDVTVGFTRRGVEINWIGANVSARIDSLPAGHGTSWTVNQSIAQGETVPAGTSVRFYVAPLHHGTGNGFQITSRQTGAVGHTFTGPAINTWHIAPPNAPIHSGTILDITSNIMASFTEIYEHWISFTNATPNGDGGSVTMSITASGQGLVETGAWVLNGTNVTFTAIPDTGWETDATSWVPAALTATANENVRTSTITAPVAASVEFSVIPAGVTFNHNPEVANAATWVVERVATPVLNTHNPFGQSYDFQNPNYNLTDTVTFPVPVAPAAGLSLYRIRVIATVPGTPATVTEILNLTTPGASVTFDILTPGASYQALVYWNLSRHTVTVEYRDYDNALAETRTINNIPFGVNIAPFAVNEVTLATINNQHYVLDSTSNLYGRRFVNWTGGGTTEGVLANTATPSTQMANIRSDRTIVANFVLMQRSISFTTAGPAGVPTWDNVLAAGTNNTVFGALPTTNINFGRTIATYPATSAASGAINVPRPVSPSGWLFDGWSAAASSNPFTMPSANLVLTANFDTVGNNINIAGGNIIIPSLEHGYTPAQAIDRAHNFVLENLHDSDINGLTLRLTANAANQTGLPGSATNPFVMSATPDGIGSLEMPLFNLMSSGNPGDTAGFYVRPIHGLAQTAPDTPRIYNATIEVRQGNVIVASFTVTFTVTPRLFEITTGNFNYGTSAPGLPGVATNIIGGTADGNQNESFATRLVRVTAVANIGYRVVGWRFFDDAGNPMTPAVVAAMQPRGAVSNILAPFSPPVFGDGAVRFPAAIPNGQIGNSAVTFIMPTHDVHVVALWAIETITDPIFNIRHYVTTHHHLQGSGRVHSQTRIAISGDNVTLSNVRFPAEYVSGISSAAFRNPPGWTAISGFGASPDPLTWNRASTPAINATPNVAFDMPGNDVELRVDWARATFVTVVPNNPAGTTAPNHYAGTSGNGPSVQIAQGNAVHIFVGSMYSQGYVFDGWTFWADEDSTIPLYEDPVHQGMSGQPATNLRSARTSIRSLNEDVFAIASWRAITRNDNGGTNGGTNGNNGTNGDINGSNGTNGGTNGQANGGNGGWNGSNGNGGANGSNGNGGNGDTNGAANGGSGNGGPGTGTTTTPPPAPTPEPELPIAIPEPILPPVVAEPDIDGIVADDGEPSADSDFPIVFDYNNNGYDRPITIYDLIENIDIPIPAFAMEEIARMFDEGYDIEDIIGFIMAAIGSPGDWVLDDAGLILADSGHILIEAIIMQDVGNPETGDRQTFTGIIASSVALILSSSALLAIALTKKKKDEKIESR